MPFSLLRAIPNFQKLKLTSLPTRKYNCLAWAAEESTRRWEPDKLKQYHWPKGVAREYTVDAYVEAYRTIGYELCEDASLQPALQKIAIYAVDRNGQPFPTHAARQTETGAWTSKLGDEDDVEHALDDVNGAAYGKPILFMARPRPAK